MELTCRFCKRFMQADIDKLGRHCNSVELTVALDSPACNGFVWGEGFYCPTIHKFTTFRTCHVWVRSKGHQECTKKCKYLGLEVKKSHEV